MKFGFDPEFQKEKDKMMQESFAKRTDHLIVALMVDREEALSRGLISVIKIRPGLYDVMYL